MCPNRQTGVAEASGRLGQARPDAGGPRGAAPDRKIPGAEREWLPPAVYKAVAFGRSGFLGGAQLGHRFFVSSSSFLRAFFFSLSVPKFGVVGNEGLGLVL